MNEDKFILAYAAYLVWKRLPCRVQKKIVEVSLGALAQALRDQYERPKDKKRKHHDTRSDSF